MLRFIYVIVMRIFSILHFCPKMDYWGKHPEKYDEVKRYELAQDLVGRVRKTARVTTEVYGRENLPKDDGGYILVSNHQGKYDTLGIIYGHERPLTILMNKQRSKMPVADQLITLLHGKRIDVNNPRQSVKTLREIAEEVKEGRVYLIFPEGGYPKDQKNQVGEFKYGAFVSAQKAQCPIVPVALIDSYKPFGVNSLKRVTTKVVFLPAIPYEEYKSMKSQEVCAMVREIIENEVNRRLADAEASA